MDVFLSLDISDAGIKHGGNTFSTKLTLKVGIPEDFVTQ